MHAAAAGEDEPRSQDTVADVLDVPRGHDVDPAAYALIRTTIIDLYR
ncbi:hypothetical protein ACFW93_01290 [Streptomyces canus]